MPFHLFPPSLFPVLVSESGADFRRRPRNLSHPVLFVTAECHLSSFTSYKLLPLHKSGSRATSSMHNPCYRAAPLQQRKGDAKDFGATLMSPVPSRTRGAKMRGGFKCRWQTKTQATRHSFSRPYAPSLMQYCVLLVLNNLPYVFIHCQEKFENRWAAWGN